MRYLSIDLGDKRTGLATGDSITGIVTPAGTLEIARGERLLAAVCEAVDRHEPDAIVIGVPLHDDGRESAGSRTARAFGGDLASRTGRPVHFQDERLTSYAADQQMARSGRTHKQKKQVRDALAAAEILREYLGSLEA